MSSRKTILIVARAACASLVLALASGQQPRAATADVLPFKATELVLANGLKVIIVPTGFPNLVSVQIPVQTGSRNEVEPGKSGFAHFFEHLMFRGTPTTPPEKYREIMGKAGARDNASTSDDYTHYYSTFAKEHLEQVIALYADMFQHLAYAEADFKTEAQAILGEYNKNSANPIQKLIEAQRERYYQAHTYKHTTMGFIRDIENMPKEYAYSKLFFERWYRPQNTALVIAGDVTPEQVRPLVEKYWGGWKAGTGAPAPIPQEPAPKGPMYVHVPWASDTLPIVSVAFPSPAFVETSKDSAAIDILAALYFGSTSELYKKLVVAEQKVDALDVDVPANVDASLFTVLARVKDPADAVYVRDQILATIATARSALSPAARLADAKSYNRYAFARTLDSTERIATVVAAYASYRRSFDTVNAYFRTLDSLTPADLQAAARKYFTDAGMIVATLSTQPLPAGIQRAPSIGSVKPAAAFAPASSKAAPPVLPPPAAAATSSGVRLLQQKSVLPQLNVKMVFTAGSAHDPAGKEGLAALTAAMIADAGSRAMTIDQIEAVLYPMAGSFTGRADKEMTVFTGIIHRDHWQKFLGTVLPQLVDPGFRDEDFKRLKDAQLNALVQDLRSNNEEELGKERLQTNIFRGTPVRARRAWNGRRPRRHHAGRRQAVRQGDVHAREPHAGPERRCAGGDGGRAAVRARGPARRQRRPARRRARHAARGDRSRDPREGHPRDRHLVRVSDRGHARASGFRGPVDRPRRGWESTASDRGVCISGSARSAASTTATTRTSRRSRAGCSSSSRTRTSCGSVRSSRSGFVRSCR